MSLASDQRLLANVKRWEAARNLAMRKLREARDFECEREVRAMYSEDGDSVPPCWREPSGNLHEKCPTCQKREPVWREFIELRRIESGYLRSLRALIDRRELARGEVEGEEAWTAS